MPSDQAAPEFEFRRFERFPRAVGLVRGECVALVEQTPEGFRLIGEPGWLIGDNVGVLVTSGGRSYFQFKEQRVEATADRLQEVARFSADVQEFISTAGG